MDKRDLCELIAKKLGNKIEIAHVTSVVNLICEEILLYLKDTAKFKIGNFGTLFFKTRSGMRVFGVRSKKFEQHGETYYMYFRLFKPLSRFLSSKMDKDAE